MHGSFKVVGIAWFIWEVVVFCITRLDLALLSKWNSLGNMRGAIGSNFAQARGTSPRWEDPWSWGALGTIFAQMRNPSPKQGGILAQARVILSKQEWPWSESTLLIVFAQERNPLSRREGSLA